MAGRRRFAPGRRRSWLRPAGAGRGRPAGAASALLAAAPEAVVDPLGGAADLAAGRLRLCAPGALAADPVRVLRLARFACGLALQPEPGRRGGRRAQRPAASLAVSGERIERELSALLLALPQRVAALRLLDACGGARRGAART